MNKRILGILFCLLWAASAFAGFVQIDALWNGLRDNNGVPLAGGKVYTYYAGTSTPMSVYQDAGGVSSWTWPVILDNSGRALVFTSTAVRLRVTDSTGVAVCDYDNLIYSASLDPVTDVLTSTYNGQTFFFLSKLTTSSYMNVYVNGIKQASGTYTVNKNGSGQNISIDFNTPLMASWTIECVSGK